ncbi:MAG TPA: hypothetical protein PLN69_10250 [bacterium]|nr:hypothetical protein [bacterium]
MTSKSIASGKAMALERDFGYQIQDHIHPKSALGADGEYYSKYSPLNSFLMLPLVWIGLNLHGIMPEGTSPDMQIFFMAGFLNPIITAATVVCVALLCAGLGISRRSSIITAAIFGFCTMALPYSKTSFTEPMAALCICASLSGAILYRKTESKTALLLAMAGAALLPLARLSSIVAVVPVLLYLTTRKDFWKAAVPAGCAVAAGLLIYGLLNYMRFGSFLETGYGSEAVKFDSPFLIAVYGYIFSSDKSIFAYSPPLLLAIPGLVIGFRKKLSREMLCIAGIFLISIIVYGRWYGWEGGHAWGPRFMLTVIPVLMAAAGLFIENAARKPFAKIVLYLLVLLGLTVQFAATSVKFNPNYENISVKYDIEDAYSEGRLFSPGAPRFLPFKKQFRVTLAHYSYTFRHIREYLGHDDYTLDELKDSKLVENAPDMWPFLVWISSGVKIRIMVMIIVFVLAAGVVLSVRALCKSVIYSEKTQPAD